MSRKEANRRTLVREGLSLRAGAGKRLPRLRTGLLRRGLGAVLIVHGLDAYEEVRKTGHTFPSVRGRFHHLLIAAKVTSSERPQVIASTVLRLPVIGLSGNWSAVQNNLTIGTVFTAKWLRSSENGVAWASRGVCRGAPILL